MGCKRSDGRWLLIRRSEHVVAPLKVCFPGGALEPGEDVRAAAIREMREELGVEIELVGQVWRHDFDDRNLTLRGYFGRLLTAELTPDPHEVAEVLWLTVKEARSHPDALPKTGAFVDALAGCEE